MRSNFLEELFDIGKRFDNPDLLAALEGWSKRWIEVGNFEETVDAFEYARYRKHKPFHEYLNDKAYVELGRLIAKDHAVVESWDGKLSHHRRYTLHFIRRIPK